MPRDETSYSLADPGEIKPRRRRRHGEAAGSHDHLHRHLLLRGCGYDLKLSSTARDVEAAWPWRRCRRSVVVFDAIDDLRFGHLDEFRCLDVRALRIFARRTRLLCRKCGAHLGYGYHAHDNDTPAAAAKQPRYHIKIRAVHPAADAYPSPSPEDPAAAAADA